MIAADPPSILAEARIWAAELHQRGQLDDAAAAQLNETLTESFGERLDQQEDPLLVVMLCGPTAVGKSSLINALAGADISQPGLGATTRAAVVYIHEQDDPSRLFEYSHALGSNEQHTTEVIRHRRDELLHKVLVDTPDIDSVRLQHKELTTGLVHAADLVLFVTSPEKYKVMRSARWILEQRQQRALAFVLNKWDRDALGLQSDRRSEIDQDFRDVLAGEGFPDALIFKVSALAEEFHGQNHIENDLKSLSTWLEAGISQSTASAIRRRRLRAAWGRLAAAIEQAAPQPLSGHPMLPRIYDRLATCGSAVARGVEAEASVLDPAGVEDGGWPVTPGLFGMWTRTWSRVAGTMAALRSGLAMLNGRAGNVENTAYGPLFGARGSAELSEAIGQTVDDASAAHLALGPVSACWTGEISCLQQQLFLLPGDIAGQLTARANRPSLRRFAGISCVYAMEALVILVLLVTIARVGIDFVAGSYAPGGLFGTAAELVLMLLIVSHAVTTMFFPPLRQRVRKAVARDARSLVKAAVERLQTLLRDHVEAVDRLAGRGRELLLRIDRALIALAAEAGSGASVGRLFGEPQSQLKLAADAAAQRAMPESAEPARRPFFE